MYSGRDNHFWLGFPIRKSPDQRLCAPPRSLSQLAASFFARCRQGIHQLLLSVLLLTVRRPFEILKRDHFSTLCYCRIFPYFFAKTVKEQKLFGVIPFG